MPILNTTQPPRLVPERVSRNLGGFSLPALQVLVRLMPNQLYNKPPLLFTQQIERLQAKGMGFQDVDLALKQLECISYYRLSAYWFPFRIRDDLGKVTNQLEADTCFGTAITLYEFDRNLRALLLDAIERVEVAIRTQFTYHLGHTYGAFAHTNATNFHPNFKHQRWLQKLEHETSRSSDEFINHYQNKYQGFPTIPIWMLTEVMSLGALSIGYGGLKNSQQNGIEDKKAVAQHFNLHHKRLGDWLHTLTYIRNICAHHSRLWNRQLAIRPDKEKEPAWQPPLTPRNNRIFYILLMLRHLLRAIGNGDDWANSINELLTPIAEHKRWRAAMGLPENWREHPLWK